MPQDPNLYGQRPAKKQKREMALSSSLGFSSQLSSLLASSSAAGTTAAGRPRTSKAKSDIFGSSKGKRKAERGDGAEGDKLVLKETDDTEEAKAERLRARKNMESKARLYNSMKRGDYVAREGEVAPLVDFDRKWAEENPDDRNGEDSSSSNDSDDDEANIDNEVIEFEDEFGRLRRGTRAEKMRLERRVARGAASAQELERMSARPKAPEGLIFGDAVQAAAFEAQDFDKMEELAAKRDRSVTPPPATHYDANWEIRTKGVGFYAFSKDGDTRMAEMQALEEERARTEKLRGQREEIAAKRKAEIEKRRKELGERKAKKMAEDFLNGLGQDIMLGAEVEGQQSKKEEV